MANYADDNTPYCTGFKNFRCYNQIRECSRNTVVMAHKDNRMKASPDKYYLLINNTKESFQIKIGNETVSNNKWEKLLGAKVDHELNFSNYISSLCKKANQTHLALSRIAPCMTKKIYLELFHNIRFFFLSYIMDVS